MVIDVVNRYVDSELGFAEWKIGAVRPIENAGEAFEVDVVLKHSSERIEQLVNEGPPEESELRRILLRDEFKATCKVVNGCVTETNWENMEFI